MAGNTVTFTVLATDPDGDTNLTYSMTLPASNPSGVSFNASTRVFTWTTTSSHINAAAYNFTFTVTDGKPDGTASTVVPITVTAQSTTPVLTTPTPGSAISISSPTFAWTKENSTSFFLGVGTTQSSLEAAPYGNIYASGWRNSSFISANVPNIPLNGNTIYVRLWYVVNGITGFKDYTYTTVNQTQSITLGTPPATTTINKPVVNFNWTRSSETNFFLSVGTSSTSVANAPYGDIYASGWQASSFTSATLNIPLNGNTLYVRLWYVLNGVTSFRDYTFTRASQP